MSEMLELINEGVTNIICVQPFACLPNHIVGKGVIKRIRHDHLDANIVAIDYDPGSVFDNFLLLYVHMLLVALAYMLAS